MIGMGKHISAEDRLNLLKGYAVSPLTVREYVLEKGVSYSTFQRWALNHGISLKKSKEAGRLGPLEAVRCQQISKTPLSKGQSVGNPPLQFMDITGNIFSKAKKEDTVSRVNDSFALEGQLDVLLPNGIRMTLHETSLNNRIALMKALVS